MGSTAGSLLLGFWLLGGGTPVDVPPSAGAGPRSGSLARASAVGPGTLAWSAAAGRSAPAPSGAAERSAPPPSGAAERASGSPAEGPAADDAEAPKTERPAADDAEAPKAEGSAETGRASEPPSAGSEGPADGPSPDPRAAAPGASAVEAAGPTTEAASTPPDEAEDLSLEDIFGDAEDVPAADVEAEALGSPEETAPGKGILSLPGTLDTRVRIVTSAYFDVDRADAPGFSRNENRLEFYFAYSPNEHIQIVGDVEPVFLGVAQAQELGDLATRSMLTPFHVESDAAYVALLDLLPGLDIKVGRQILVWGTADKFNPTNNLNPDDLEDRPLFTEPIANQMVVVDVAPWGDKVWFEGVYIPLFYPALLPPSASAALKDPQSPVPFAEYSDLRTIDALQQRLDANEALVPKVKGHIVQPKPSFRNSQAAFKIGWSFWEVDMSLSYYYGRHDIPTPVNVESTQIRPSDPAVTPPEQLHAECCFVSDAFLEYPRMQVVGYDFAAQLPFLGDLGIWGEMGLFIPERKTLRIEFPIPILVDGELRTEIEGVTIRKTPFVKATAGMDYTFGKHVYVQAQYLRGFIDEFGVDHIGNYLVAGTDLIFFGRHLIFRLFGVVDFPTGRKDFLGRKDKGSAVLFPEILMVPPWGFLTFELGGFVFLGDETTKFGQKATGSSIVFLKATGQF